MKAKKTEAKCGTAHTGASTQLQRKTPVQMLRTLTEGHQQISPASKKNRRGTGFHYIMLYFTLYIIFPLQNINL